MTDTDADRTEGKGPFWTAAIDDFGRIKSASIKMAPLVVLLGKNNTGKSYVASLLWSLLNFDDYYLASRDSIRSFPQKVADLVEPLECDTDHVESLTPKDVETWMNENIRDRKDQVVQSLLSYKEARIGGLKIVMGEDAPTCFVKREPFPDNENSGAQWTQRRMSPSAFEIDFSINPSFKNRNYLRGLMIAMTSSVAAGSFHDGPAAYLPAARTGLMLALRPLLAGALQNLGVDLAPGVDRLPLPTIRFLQSIAQAHDDADTLYEDIARFLELEVIRGKIERTGDTVPVFTFAPDNLQPLPLHVTSSMITELAPFLILLRGADFGKGLVFEEPESHLHLAAQRVVARAIVRLVNAGVPVVVTTHSDTFLQEINILMQVGARSNFEALSEELGLESDDILSPYDVRAYEFIDHEGQTIVEPAEISDYGIVATTLNDTLIELAAEAVLVQR